MTGPDARPVGETAAEAATARRAVLDMALPSVLPLVGALDAYRDAVAAEARAALLRDAPVVYVATDKSASVSELSDKPFEVSNGVAFADEDADVVTIWNHPPLTPPGTVRRYALVPIEEGRDV